MKKNYLSLLIVSFICISTTFSKEYRGSDITPKQIQKKYYVWNKKIDEPNPKSKNNEDIWYSEYTQPMEGYIILLSGEKLEGKIIVHHKWNKASQKKLKKVTYNKDGGKVINYYPDPKGIDIIEDVKLTNQDGEKTILTTEILNYGPQFKMADWELVKGQKTNADKYLEGSIEMKNGTKREGFLTINTYSFWKKKFNLRYYNYIFFSENETANAELIHCSNLKSVTQTSILYTNYKKKYVIERDLLISTLETTPDKLYQRKLEDVIITTEDGSEIEGRMSSKKLNFIFIDNDNNISYHSPKTTNIVSYIKNNTEYFLFKEEGVFKSIESLNMANGTIYYKDGSTEKKEMQYYYNYFLTNEGDGKFNKITLKNSENIDYVMISKGLSLKKVIRKEENGKAYFMKINNPDKKFSYYKNPNPTHQRTGASILTSVGASVANDMAEKALTDGGAEVEPSDEPDIEIYFKEWVVVDNKTGEKFIIYKKNIDEMKKKLLGKCQRMSVENRNIIKDISKIKEIDLLVNTLNKCADNE